MLSQVPLAILPSSAVNPRSHSPPARNNLGDPGNLPVANQRAPPVWGAFCMFPRPARSLASVRMPVEKLLPGTTAHLSGYHLDAVACPYGISGDNRALWV
jgi:hypothetical protein